MKFITLLVAFAVLVLAAAAAFAPATLLDARLDAATQGQLRLANAEGSTWNGRGRVTDAQRTWSLPVAWKVAPLEFARGGIAVALRDTGQGGDSRGNFAWRDGTLTAEGVAVSVPSAAVSGTLVADNTLALGGTLVLDASHFSWSGSGGDGAAMVRWNGARIASNAGTISLGTVTANCTPRDGRVQCKVENRGGDVRIDGEFTWSSVGVDVNAALTALPSAPPAVARALGTLGTPDASGAVRVRWRSGPR
jgi:general secretion pathway protein N